MDVGVNRENMEFVRFPVNYLCANGFLLAPVFIKYGLGGVGSFGSFYKKTSVIMD